MPIFIHEPDAFEKLVQVEGEDWREMQNEGKFGPASFSRFLEAWEQRRGLSCAALSVDGYGAIYGAGGYSRYRVTYQGEIQFIKEMTPSREKTEKAREVGFTLV